MTIKLIDFKKNFVDAIPCILLALFLFISLKAMNASDNIMLAFIIPSYFKSIKNKNLNIKEFIKDIIIFTLLGVLSNIATLSTINRIILNVLVPFCIVVFFSNKYYINKYILYGLIFVIFQMYSVPLNRLYIRVFAFIYSFSVVFIVMYISSLKRKENPIKSNIKLGLNQAINEFESIYTNENYKYDKNPLINTTNELSNLLFENNKSLNSTFDSKELYYHNFIIIFKHINQLIRYIKKLPSLDNDTKYYFLNLSTLIKNINSKDSPKLIQEFVQKNKLKNYILDKESKYILNTLLYLVKNTSEKHKNNYEASNSKINIFNGISFNIESTKFRFAIRLSTVMLICSIIVTLINPYIPKAYWLTLNSYIMILPFYEDSTTRVFQRMKGTIIGLIIFYISFHILGYTKFSVTLFTIIGIIAMFIVKTYYIRTSMTTSFALFLSSGAINSSELIFLRMGLVVLAAILVYLSNKLILPTGKYEELLKSIKELINLDKKVLNLIYEFIYEYKNIDINALNRYLLEAEMLSRNIETYEASQKKYKSDDISKEFLIYNQKLLLELVRMLKIVSNTNLTSEDIDYFKNVIIKIENSLTDIYSIVDKYYTNYDIDNDMPIINQSIYMNETLINSIKNIYEFNHLIYDNK